MEGPSLLLLFMEGPLCNPSVRVPLNPERNFFVSRVQQSHQKEGGHFVLSGGHFRNEKEFVQLDSDLEGESFTAAHPHSTHVHVRPPTLLLNSAKPPAHPYA